MNQLYDIQHNGTSKLLSALILLFNKEFGWPIRTTHGPIGVVYVEYKTKGATITLYGRSTSASKDDLDIHIRIHEFTADMTDMIASIHNQLDELVRDPSVMEHRYVVFEESPHGAVS